MAEVKRDPVPIIMAGISYDAFDEDHTLADIARWIMKNKTDAEELHYILGEMLNDRS